MKRSRWRPSLVLLLITAIAAAGRIALLDQAMRADEAMTFTRFARSLPAALTDYSAPNNHILHSVLVWASTQLFGPDPWAIRLPAALFGVALVITVDWWVTSAHGKQAGVVAAALTAGAYYLVLYSTIARGYTMLAVAYVVLLELSRRILVGHASRRTWLGWILTATLGLATVPVFAFPLAAVIGWMSVDMLARRRGPGWKALASASAAVAGLSVLVYLPAAIAMGPAAIVANDFLQPVALADLGDAWAELVADVVSQIAKDGWVALAFTPMAALALAERRSFEPTLNPAWGLMAVFALVAARMWAPPTRTFLFIWPLLAGLAGIGAILFAPRLPSLIRRSWVIPVLSVALAGFMTIDVLSSGYVTSARDAGTFRDGPEVAQFLHDRLADDDRIVVESHPRPVLEYYLHRLGWGGPQLKLDYENAQRLFVVVYHPRPQDLDGVLARVPRAEFSEPRLLADLPETDIYVMDR